MENCGEKPNLEDEMGFTSLAFLVFFFISILVYFALPGKAKAAWLLAASYGFALSFGFSCLAYLFASTVLAYAGALLIERGREERSRKLWFFLALFLHLGGLCFFKYRGAGILLPVGLSFYTFQSVGYLADVYQGKLRAEKSFLHFALFEAFFPKLVQGPIERAQGLLEQLHGLEERRDFAAEEVREGCLLALWGLFLKLVIADRLAIPVNAVYSQFGAFGGVELLLATFLYAFQIYCDFAGYTCIARGTARIFGIRLAENFRRPYLADSVQDFWRRWHMSLSSWLRDYIYIPLGGNRKGRLRKYGNVMLTFLVSGIWHGTGFHFLLWGLLQGAGQLVDMRKWKLPRPIKQFLVFCFVDAAWMVFRVNSLGDLRGMIAILLRDFRLRDFAGMQLGRLEWLLVLLGLLLVVGKDILNEKGIGFRRILKRQPWPLRCLAYTALLGGIVIFGVYGAAYDTSGFLYTQF